VGVKGESEVRCCFSSRRSSGETGRSPGTRVVQKGEKHGRGLRKTSITTSRSGKGTRNLREKHVTDKIKGRGGTLRHLTEEERE